MWKTGWKILLVLLLVALLVSFRGRNAEAKKDADFVKAGLQTEWKPYFWGTGFSLQLSGDPIL